MCLAKNKFSLGRESNNKARISKTQPLQCKRNTPDIETYLNLSRAVMKKG